MRITSNHSIYVPIKFMTLFWIEDNVWLVKSFLISWGILCEQSSNLETPFKKITLWSLKMVVFGHFPTFRSWDRVRNVHLNSSFAHTIVLTIWRTNYEQISNLGDISIWGVRVTRRAPRVTLLRFTGPLAAPLCEFLGPHTTKLSTS